MSENPTKSPTPPWYRTPMNSGLIYVGDLVLAAFRHRFHTEWRLGIVRELEQLTDSTDRRGVSVTNVSLLKPFVAKIDGYPDTTRTPFSAWFYEADVQPYVPLLTDEELEARQAWETLS